MESTEWWEYICRAMCAHESTELNTCASLSLFKLASYIQGRCFSVRSTISSVLLAPSGGGVTEQARGWFFSSRNISYYTISATCRELNAPPTYNLPTSPTNLVLFYIAFFFEFHFIIIFQKCYCSC